MRPSRPGSDRETNPGQDLAPLKPEPQLRIVIARVSLVLVVAYDPHVAPTQLYVPKLTVPGRVVVP